MAELFFLALVQRLSVNVCQGSICPRIKLKPFSLVVIAGLGELIGADAISLCCACGAGLGVASLSASYPVAPSLMMTVGSLFFLFPFCLVNLVEGMCNLVQKHQVWCTHAAKAFD
jgi:hypothetical protein